MSSFRPRPAFRAGNISNRERQRRANRAIENAAAAEVLVKLLLAQAGGEVTIAKGTASQIPAGSSIEVTPKENGEAVIRLLLGTEEGPSDVAHQIAVLEDEGGPVDVVS